MWSIVLISQPPSTEVAKACRGRRAHLGVPALNAPNPTTGFFFYVLKTEIIDIDMSAEDAATLIMSAGVVQPGSDSQKKIAALAEMAMRRGSRCARVAQPARVD